MSHKLVTFIPAEAGTQFCSIADGYFVPWMPAFAGTNGEWVRHVAQTRYVHPRASGDPDLLNCRRVLVLWMPAFAGTNGEWVRHVAQTRYVYPRGSGDPVLLNCRRVLRSLDARFRGHERRM